MKFNNILLAGVSLLLAVACEPMEDINNELDESYNGPLRQDLVYELTGSDYKTISASALEDALSTEEYEAASTILEGDTALTDDQATTYIPELLANMEDMYGYAPGSINAVTFKYREDVDATATDSIASFYKFSVYSWMLLPDAGYEYDFEDGTAYENIDLDGWTQYNLGTSTDMTWIYKSYSGNTYAYGTAYNGENSGGYDIWLVSPGLDLEDVIVDTNLKFETAQAYANGSELKVYIMDSADPSTATVKDEITANITLATSEDNNYEFISSGAIDLSSYSGTVYVAFEYVADAGETTSFCIDNFMFDFLEVE